MAQASEELLDVAELAREVDTSEPVIRVDIGQLHALGLVLDGLEEGLPPMLLNTGRQFLARGGDVDHDALSFLPRVIDGLNARAAVDERLAPDIFAAAVALMARLSDGAPAGCVAEEIISVGLIEQARVWLEMRREEGELDDADEHDARDELRGLFELFEDDDVLNMFEMAEPADAALAGHDPINQQLGVADQRVHSWFRAFGGTAPTGYLRDQIGAPDDN